MSGEQPIPFAAIAADVARALLGEPNPALSTRTEFRYGSRGSLAVHVAGPRAGTWRDHEAGEGGGILALIGRQTGQHNGAAVEWLRAHGFADAAPALAPAPHRPRRIVATYDYRAADGTLLFQVVRFDPKDFRQRRPVGPDGPHGWSWDLSGVQRVLYRLPAILAAPPGATIWIVEGEKAADALTAAGLIATCSPGGAGKWSASYNAPLLGSHVVILPDNDAPGAAHAEQVARSLAGVAASVRILPLPGLPPKGDVFDWLAGGGDPAELPRLAADARAAPEAGAGPEPPFDPEDPGPQPDSEAAPPSDILPVPFPNIPINEIPPRPWAYGTFLLFRQASVLGAVDGGGKGAIATSIALAFVTGRPLLGERVWRPGPVAILTYEDDQTEWQRRIAAACIVHEVDYAEAIAQIFLIAAPSRAIRLAVGGERTSFPDGAGVAAAVRHYGCALLIIDPINHAHDLQDGNSNALIAQLAGEITRIARDADCTVLALHHLRKGATGQADDLMGATSLRATFRAARILQRMDPDTAERLGVDEPWRYTRIAGTKENYAPPPDKATWFKLESQELGNPAGIYEHGDNVAVAVPWAPPSPFAGLSWQGAVDVLDAIDRGLPSGERYTATRRGRAATRWAGSVLTAAGVSDAAASAILKAWLSAGLLTEQTYQSPTDRHDAKGLFVDPAKLAEMRREGVQKPSWED